MKIIGHRGAAGLAPENTIAAIKAGIDAGADALEFDVRLTSDGEFVLCHDIDLQRTAHSTVKIHNATLAELYKIEFLDGELIPTLQDALDAALDKTAVIEMKGLGWAEPLAEILSKHDGKTKFCIIAFNHAELLAFHSLAPKAHCYALERNNPFTTIRMARRSGLTGVDLNYWLVNPFTYCYARILNLKVITYTVDSPLLMKYFSVFYPELAITTNYPDKLNKIANRK